MIDYKTMTDVVRMRNVIEDAGFKLSFVRRSGFWLSPDPSVYPGYVEDANVYTAATLDEACAFVVGFVSHKQYLKLSGQAEAE